MQAREEGLYDSDFAVMVRGEFEKMLERGIGVPEATTELLEEYAYVFDPDGDEDDAAVLYLVVADQQLERGALQAEIREVTLKFIDEGKGLDAYSDDPEDLAERQEMYDHLRARLMTAAQ
jgi:hypothetical protein